MWLVVTADLELYDPTNDLELRKDVLVELFKVLVELRVLKLQCHVYPIIIIDNVER